MVLGQKRKGVCLVKKSNYTTKEAIFTRAQEAINLPLSKIDTTNRLKTGKGGIGNAIEEGWFGYTPNSDTEPDFPEAGIELKVTPYLRNKDKIRAKERLVCNIINYMEEYSKTFKTSAFWQKCNTLLIMTYEYLKNKPKEEFKIDSATLFSYPEEDLAIIEQDWGKIMNKVRAGKAHEISEGDTLYLAACTKGANASSVREQPCSSQLAKQRAYSLKASYITQILNKYIFGNEKSPRIIKSLEALKSTSFEDYIINKVRPFYGKTQAQLREIFNIKSNAKSINEILLAKMLNIKGHISHTEEFKKAGIVPKTIRVQKDRTVKESMSFPTFDFIDLTHETIWEESTLYNYLAPTKFLFVIFQEQANGEYVFNRVMFWNISNKDLEEVRKVWERTRHLIKEGVQLIKTTTQIRNNLPKKSENEVAHVRPHGRNANDRCVLPDGRMMTKQCFWLNNSYIAKQINDSL